MKILVTHLSVDLDALASIWLVRRFFPGWEEASLQFVPAGETLHGKNPDENPDIIHSDTGLGRFDHHQTDAYISATKLVCEHILQENYADKKIQKALERFTAFVNDIDHFADVYFPEPTADRYAFLLPHIIDGLRSTMHDDAKIAELIFPILDAQLQILKNKICAEDEIKKGFIFQSSRGKSLALETKNEDTMKLALKMGYALVIRRDPAKGHMRIKTLPEKKYDLTPVYEMIAKKDKKATWFLHASKNMLLNGSSKNPNFIPSSLSLKQLIEILRKV